MSCAASSIHFLRDNNWRPGCSKSGLVPGMGNKPSVKQLSFRSCQPCYIEQIQVGELGSARFCLQPPKLKMHWRKGLPGHVHSNSTKCQALPPAYTRNTSSLQRSLQKGLLLQSSQIMRANNCADFLARHLTNALSSGTASSDTWAISGRIV